MGYLLALFIVIIIYIYIQKTKIINKLKWDIKLRDEIEENIKNRRNMFQLDDDMDEEVKIYNNSVVLIVDDEETILNMFESILSRYGFKVLPFMDPYDAISFFENNYDFIDVVITDMGLGGSMSGIELIKKIKSISPNIPVILCTGYSYIKFDDNNDKDLISQYIYKPTKASTLINTIINVLKDKG